MSLAWPAVSNCGCTKPGVEPGSLRLKMTSDYHENRNDSTRVRTQIAQIGDIETISNRRFVRAAWVRTQVTRTKNFQLLEITIGLNARAVVQTYACWIKQQQFNHEDAKTWSLYAKQCVLPMQ